MDLTERLALIVDAHTEGAVSSIRKLSLEEKAAGEQAEVLKARITDLEARMASSRTGGSATQQIQLRRLRSEYDGLNATLAKMPANAGRVESALSKVGLGGLVSGQTLAAGAKVLPGLAGGALAFGGFEFLKTGVEEYVNLAGAILQFQRASGASAEEASRLVAVTNVLGVDSQTAALGVFRLGKNIALQPDNFAKLGIQIARTKTGQADLVGTLENVAQAWQHANDPARRAAIVYEAFGRAGTTMLPVLAATKDQLEEIANEAQKQGRVFSQDELERARQYQIEIREMKDSWEGLAITAGKSVVPALTQIAHLMGEIGTLGRTRIGGILGDLSKFDNPVSAFYHAGMHGLDLVGLGGGGGSSPAASAEAARQAQEDQAARDALSQQTIANLPTAFAQVGLTQAVSSAKQTLIQSRQELTNARADRDKALRDLQNVGSASATSADIAAASARLDAARLNLQRAQYVGGDANIASAKASLITAQQRLNDLQSQGGVDSDRLAAAQDRLRRANLRLHDATKAVSTAQQGVNEAHGLTARQVLGRAVGQRKNQEALANANVKLATAGISQTELAQLDQLDAQIPGTLVRVARTINQGLVGRLNAEAIRTQTAQQKYADAVVDADKFYAAGLAAGKAAVRGLRDGFGGFSFLNPPASKAPTAYAPGARRTDMTHPSAQYVRVGTIRVEHIDDALTRLLNLSGGASVTMPRGGP